MPSDIWKRFFEWNGCKISWKQEVRAKTARFHEKWTPELNKKRCFKHSPTNRKMFKKWLAIRVRKITIIWEWGLLGHLWWPKPLWASKVSPERSQNASHDRTMTQQWPQRVPWLRKTAPILEPVRSLADGLRDAFAIKTIEHYLKYVKSWFDHREHLLLGFERF